MSGSTLIQNRTPATLILTGAEDKQITLAPLQQLIVEDASAFDFSAAKRRGLVDSISNVAPDVGSTTATILVGGGVWGVLLAWGVSSMGPYFGLSEANWRWTVWLTVGIGIVVIVLGNVIHKTKSLALITRFSQQLFALAVILTIGLGLPAWTVYFFANGSVLVVELDSGAGSLTLFSRLLQLAFIAVASLLPVLLYFLFDRFQLVNLRRRLYAALFRLNPDLKTVDDIMARYGAQIEEEYGTENLGRSRLAPGSRWPVLVCAFMITIGWIVALAPVGSDFAPESVNDALRGLMPQQTAFVFGFLGAYFFSLRLIAIRYARGDLKPKAYSYIMVRLIIVAILSWMLEVMYSDESRLMLLLAFLFGITPDEFFTFLKELIRTRVLPGIRAVLPESVVPVPTTLPLTDIEGIDLYDRGRLESEGIVNVEGLAHHELIDLIIETRIPVPRMVDWVDQAILYLHLTGGSGARARQTLRDFGIRTATDLYQCRLAAQDRGEASLQAFYALLGGQAPVWRMEVIMDAMADDEWLQEVLAWRSNAIRGTINCEAVPEHVHSPAVEESGNNGSIE